MSTNPNTVKSQDDLIKKAFENQNDDLIKNVLNSGYIKSQDDLNPCNDGKRSSEVLLSTIEELERTKKQLAIAVNCLKQYANRDNWYNRYKPNSLDECPIASKERWKKEYGYKQAEKALGKIEELNK